MGKTVAAFNIIAGRDPDRVEGWLLMQILKDVRDRQRRDAPRLARRRRGVRCAEVERGSREVMHAKTAPPTEERARESAGSRAASLKARSRPASVTTAANGCRRRCAGATPSAATNGVRCNEDPSPSLLCMLFGQWPAAIFFAIIAAVLKPR